MLKDNSEKIFLGLWFILNIGLGILIMQDYGMSIDEENYFLYAESSIKAYSSFFGYLYEPNYGPGNLPYYGPAFLIFSYFPILLSSKILPNIIVSDFWHFSYFLTFQLTGLSIYFLVKRWFKQWTAWSVLILFTTQPLLWGHAFINPKDIPFMFFFTFSVLTGFWMVDNNGEKTAKFSLKKYHLWLQKKWSEVLPQKRNRFSFWLKVDGIFLLMLFVFSRSIVKAVVHFFYDAPEGSWAKNTFAQLASQSNAISAENYIHKAQALFLRAEYLFLLVNFVIVIFILIRLLSQNFTQINFREWLFKKKITERVHLFIKKNIKKQSLLSFTKNLWQNFRAGKILLAGIILGITISVRVLGPLAGGIVALYLFFKEGKNKFAMIIAYFSWAFITSYFT